MNKSILNDCSQSVEQEKSINMADESGRAAAPVQPIEKNAFNET
jgi:hypothetical protein